MIISGDLYYMVGSSWSGDPAKEKDYNHWYDTEHLPQITSMPGNLRGDRYIKVEGNDKSDKYLAAYFYSDVEGWEKFKKHPMRVFLKYAGWQKFPEGGFEASYHVMYKQLSMFNKNYTDQGGVGGFLAINGVNFADATREAAFIEWNNNHYFPKILASPELLKVKQLLGFDGWGDENDPTPKYVTVCEFANEAAYRKFSHSAINKEARQELMNSWPIGKPGFEMLWDAVYKRMTTCYKQD